MLSVSVTQSFLFHFAMIPLVWGGFRKRQNKGGMFLPLKMPGRMCWRVVKGSRALPVWQQVDRLENRATIQKHPSSLAKMTNSWDRITPNNSTGWGSLLEEECGSCWAAEQCPWWPWGHPQTQLLNKAPVASSGILCLWVLKISWRCVPDGCVNSVL